MTPEQLDAYARNFRIEEISQKMQGSDPIPPPNSKRSPSPAPEYDASGRRTNTRQHRYRQGLEAERRALVGAAMDTIPGYQQPRDLHGLRQQPIIIAKVYIPVHDFPGINFIGQILGPRGQSLADMNKQSGAHIAIRGKGSVKEGRAGHRGHRNNNNATNNDMQAPLHCLIRADTQEKADHAKTLINEVIEAAACAPEDQNQRKRDQLRQLAVMNGTFRDDEGQGRACENCGEPGHRRYFCTTPARFVAANVTCHSCGSAGHVARDCPLKKNDREPAKMPPWRVGRLARAQAEDLDAAAGPDAEFEQLLLELGN